LTLGEIAESAPPKSVRWDAPECHPRICLYPHRKGRHSLPIIARAIDRNSAFEDAEPLNPAKAGTFSN
jgi:hypothetical protein